jgi:hypothetical protein
MNGDERTNELIAAKNLLGVVVVVVISHMMLMLTCYANKNTLFGMVKGRLKLQWSWVGSNK